MMKKHKWRCQKCGRLNHNVHPECQWFSCKSTGDEVVDTMREILLAKGFSEQNAEQILRNFKKEG